MAQVRAAKSQDGAWVWAVTLALLHLCCWGLGCPL